MNRSSSSEGKEQEDTESKLETPKDSEEPASLETAGSNADDPKASPTSETKETTIEHSIPEEKNAYSTRGTRAQEDLNAVGDLLALASPEPRQSLARESFLTDSLTEEERRTRTRSLPDVDGMQSLTRLEVKSDLGLARSEHRFKRRGNNVRPPRDSNDTDEEMPDQFVAADEEPAVHTIPMNRNLLSIPAINAFLPPPSGLDQHRSPQRVEAIVAFNPPRPSESVGLVRAHRLERWERHPDEIDADLNKCRKTVQKTREELANVETLLGTVTAVDNCLRRHFFHQITCLNEEMESVGDSLSVAQAECLAACQLPSQRTRTRGSFKTGSILKDVLHALRAKSRPLKSDMDIDDQYIDSVKGDGGLASVNLADWDRSAVDRLPETPLKPTWADGTTSSGGNVVSVEVGTKLGDTLIPPRAHVQYPYGHGYHTMDELKVHSADPATMSDEQLVQRWESLIPRGSELGGTVDITSNARELKLATLEEQEGQDTSNDQNPDQNTSHKPLVPFGSGTIPTASGRGGELYKMSHEELHKQMLQLLEKGKGVLGTSENAGVPTTVRSLEEKKRRELQLRAKVLHLRNQLVRQRRTRHSNEKIYSAMQERAGRVESLVAEMRTDLKSLKRRLDQEMRDLGINEEQAESILTSFYMSLDSQHQGESSPPKRARRASRMDEDLEDIPAVALPDGAEAPMIAQQ